MKSTGKNLLLALMVLIAHPAIAQSDYKIFRDSSTLTEEKDGRLDLEIDNLNYLRNYEYFGKIPLSYTLIGYQLIPQIKYQLNKNFLVKGGVFLRREFGREGFVATAPVLTAKYQKKSFSMILGTLEGSTNHRFIEPVYDMESFINDRIEQGAQVLIDKKKLWVDWYIDWEKAIERYELYREEFTSGVSSRVKLINNDKFRMEIPLQIMMAHKGGQLDTSNLPVETLMNSAVGLSFGFQVNSSFLRSVVTEHYYTYYKDMSGAKLQPFKDGNGWYSSLVFKTRILDIDARYWKGHEFIGPRGGPLYSSVSEKIQGHTEPDRELLFLSFIYNKELFNDLFLDLRMEPYYDLRNKFTEYSYSVFLRFKKDFLLKKLKD
jgi:hypothetical protein